MITRFALGNRYPIKKLGDIVQFLDNMRRPVTEADRNPGPFPYYGANGQQGVIDAYLFDEPLVLLAEDGGHFDSPERGIAYRISGKTWVNNHAHVLRPRADVSIDYLCRVLENYDVKPWVTGTTRGKLTKAGACEIEVPLPPLPEQRRIAAILDKADALRSKPLEAIAKLNQLLQSAFLDMFDDPVTNPKGWPVSDFGKAIELTIGYPFKSAEFLDAGAGMKLCRGTNVLPGELDWSDEANIAGESVCRFEQFKVKPDDIVVAMDRPWISSGFKAVLVTPDDPECLLVQRVARLRCKAPFTPHFIYAQVQSEYFKRHCKPTETTIPHISPNDFRSFPILSPPAALIERYEGIAKEIAMQGRRMSDFASKANDLFATTQHRVFSETL